MSGKAVSANPDLINFFPGHPTLRLLPRKEILEASQEVLFPNDDSPMTSRDFSDPDNRDPLQYGTDEGALWVRKALAGWVNEKFKLDKFSQVTYDCINLTAGASNGVLNTLLQTTSAQSGYTKQAFIVTPCYYLINDCFVDAGFKGKITAIDEGNDGQLDLDYLIKQLEYHQSQTLNVDETDGINIGDVSLLDPINDEPRGRKKVYKYVIWCVPSFSNPGGLTLSLKTREKLIEIARRYDVLIITDDVYDFLDYSPGSFEPIPRFDALDRKSLPKDNLYGNVVSNGSLSKLIAPGLRVGWQMTATKKLAYQLSQGGANTSGGTPSHFNSCIAGNLILTRKIDYIIDNFNQVFSERSKSLIESVAKCLPKDVVLQGGQGGYFFWLTFPKYLNCYEVCKKAKEKNVNLANGDFFEVTGDLRKWGKSSVRLSVSYLEKEQIEKGIKTLGQVCQELSS